MRIDRDAATSVLKHIQRACARFLRWEKDVAPAPKDPNVAEFRELIADLQREVVAPIDAIYPDLAGKDLTNSKPDPDQSAKRAAGEPKSIGEVTARHLAWALEGAADRANGPLQTNPKPCAPDDLWACSQARTDVAPEFDFALTYVHRDYPVLERERMAELTARGYATAKRTAESDAQFRKLAAKLGTTKLTPAAMAQVNAFANALRESNPACQVVALSFDLGSLSKGPNDTYWVAHDPQLSEGGFYCRELPPDVIQIVSGVRMMFEDDATHKFENKLIDYREGKFELREQ